jgi:hypothetical protein
MRYHECRMVSQPKVDYSFPYKQGMLKQETQQKEQTMKAPVIVTVSDERLHVIERTVIEYEQIDELKKKLKDVLEKNQWSLKLIIPASETYFLHALTQRGAA